MIVSTPPLGSVVVSAAPVRAGARAVRLTLSARVELQCGHPGPGPLVIRLPDAATVGPRIPRSSVLVDGAPVAAAQVHGHTVTLTVLRPGGMICDVIAPGTVTVTFTAAANVGSPAKAGSYPVTVRVSGGKATGRWKVP